uniref:hypothetical protein n=1 Tax=Enterocloster clostridioformis TaxID=1531 RepID=UPI0026F16D96|nr:hypothetical protein [Enterocloster clostridioformis]
MRICRGIDILKSDQVAVSKEDLSRMEAMLYALAIKFLDKTELRKVKEKINMTLLGQMLMEDGIEKGEMTKLISQVMKKMKKGLSPEETAELLEESPDCVSRIYAAVQANPGWLTSLLLSGISNIASVTGRRKPKNIFTKPAKNIFSKPQKICTIKEFCATIRL